MGRTHATCRVDTREDPSHDSDVGDGRHADVVPTAWPGEKASPIVLRRARLIITERIDSPRLRVGFAPPQVSRARSFDQRDRSPARCDSRRSLATPNAHG